MADSAAATKPSSSVKLVLLGEAAVGKVSEMVILPTLRQRYLDGQAQVTVYDAVPCERLKAGKVETRGTV
jgi:hypothetical protein